jgi:hypothetical protein
MRATQLAHQDRRGHGDVTSVLTNMLAVSLDESRVDEH